MSEVELEENWKDKYFKALLEQEEVEKDFKERFGGLYTELIHAFFHFKGYDEELDEALLNLPIKEKSEKISVRELKEINRRIGNIHEVQGVEVGKAGQSDKTANVSDKGMTLADTTLISSDSGKDDFEVAREAFEYLLERLPSEVTEKIDYAAINKQLQNLHDGSSFKAVTEMIKEAIAEILLAQDKQIKELSGFLGGISQRLVGVTTHLSDENNNRKESCSDRGDLSKLVESNLNKIRQSVADAEDLSILKKAIETQIDTIDSSMTQFVDKETKRAKTAQKGSVDLGAQIKKLETEAEQLRKALEAAREEASIDSLTGVSNRRAYDERFAVEYSRWKRHHEPLTLAIMDIDHFKRINDSYGHPIGDKVLKVVAGRIQQQVRESDFFGRIGGEEFAFLMVGSRLEDSIAKIESLRESVQECNFRIKKKKFQVSMSIGTAEFRGKDTIQDVYNRADAALLLAKQTGRNKSVSEKELKSKQEDDYEIQPA